MANNNTYVFKVSDNLKDEIIDHYKDTFREKKPPYSVFQADDGAGTIVTLYESGKIMFQGISADIDYTIWKEREAFINKRDIDKELDKKKKKDEKKKEELNDTTYKYVSTIGSDEVGTGDYFGPIVVAATYVSKENISFLEELGVKDSKKITDEKIKEVVPKLIKKIPYVSYILTPREYNDVGITNMNKVKAILHNKVLYAMKNNNFSYKYIVVDQFALIPKYYEHIKDIPTKVTDISFTPHAEDKCYSVACASMIARFIFLEEMDKLSKKYGNIPKGAGDVVDEFGAKLVKEHGENILRDVAKLNFKNTEKIKKLI